MPVLRSQTVYLSITVFLSLALSQQHTLLLSHVPCFVSASRCSCSLMCLALSQHHTALALSCALLCLSITLLLLSHVPSFVSVLLSQVLCFVSASLTPFLLSLMYLPNLPCYRSCSLLCLNITPLLRLTLSQGITLLLLSMCDRLLHVVTKLSNELEINGSEIEREGIYGKTYAYIHR